jgi:hypothetical protein
MYFGALDKATREMLFFSSNTYSKYAQLSMDVLHRALHTSFSDRKSEDRFIVAYVLIDSSKAGMKNVTLKPMVTLDARGMVLLHTLFADFVNSKKGKASAAHCNRSFARESDYDFNKFIFGVTCDAFGKKEATGILKFCDDAAISSYELDPTVLTYRSKVVRVTSRIKKLIDIDI